MATVDIAGNTYNIYGSYDEALAYLAAHANSTNWDSAETEDRNKSLVSATRMLDRANWQGQKTSSSQALEFPRTGLTDKDGNAVASDAVPTLVEEACYELALQILGDAEIQDSASSGDNIKKLKAGSVSIENFRPTEGRYPRFPQAVHELIWPFLEGSSGMQAPYVAGGDGEVIFPPDEDGYGLTAGVY